MTLTKLPDTLAAREAARLIQLGYRVLRMRPDGKAPAVAKGLFGKKHPTFTNVPEDFTSGFGLAILGGPCPAWPGEDLVCLDFDNDFDPAAHGLELPPTLTSKNGRHRWYRVPAGALKCGNDWFRTKHAPEDPALDVKTDGGYAVEYPSIDKRGAMVQYDPPGWRDPAVLPAEAVAVLQKARNAARSAVASAHAQAVALAGTAAPSVAGAGGHDALWNVALDLVRGLGLSPGEALAVLKTHYNPRCTPPWGEAELMHKCEDALTKSTLPMRYLLVQTGPEGGYLISEKGSVKSCFENVVRYVRAAHGPELKWDAVALRAYLGESPVDVAVFSATVRSGINVAIGLDPSKSTACEAIEAVARERSFNRVREALDALPRWDGRRRLDRWLQESLGAADTEYTRAVGRAWLISAVARAYDPGCKADCMLLLEGAQGVGKSTALAIVGGVGYRELTFNAGDKDAMQDLRGAWVVEYSELTGLSKRDDDWLKGHISRRVDSYRASYGRDTQDFPRACVLAGTINPQGDGRYLRDSENRRYWPVACEADAGTIKARLAWLTKARDQLLSEAIAAYKAGEVWHLEADVGQTREQDARRAVDPLEYIVPELVADTDEVNIRMLRQDPRLARDLDGSAESQGRRIAKVLKRLGFKQLNAGRPVWARGEALPYRLRA